MEKTTTLATMGTKHRTKTKKANNSNTEN